MRPDLLTMHGFVRHKLDDEHVIYSGRLPDCFLLDENQFQELWDLHPAERSEIFLHGKWREIPRFQKAYGMDYRFSGQISQALPIPDLLRPFHEWSCEAIDSRLNGLLLNWYDAEHGHYMGKHRDSTVNLVPDSPIVTISIGATRVFRLRPYKGNGYVDFSADNGAVFVIPFNTNLAWTHEITHRKSNREERVSITLRAFESETDVQ